jgi:hypothetical protein
VAGPDAGFMDAPWALHPYQYVHQTPIVYWDPDGRFPWLIPLIVVALIEYEGGANAVALDTPSEEIVSSPTVGDLAKSTAKLVVVGQYVDQNPVVYWDPDGRQPVPKIYAVQAYSAGAAEYEFDTARAAVAVGVVGAATLIGVVCPECAIVFPLPRRRLRAADTIQCT